MAASITRGWDEEAIAIGQDAAIRRTASGAPAITGDGWVRYRSTTPSTIASSISSTGTWSSRSRDCIVAAHSAEFAPITACWSPSVHGRSCARA